MKTTGKHFAFFVREVQRWLKRFALDDWNVTFAHEACDEKGDLADCTSYYASHRAVVRLNAAWVCPVTLRQLRQTAFHEAAELLLAAMNCLSQSRFVVCEDEIHKERHAVIERLRKALCGS